MRRSLQRKMQLLVVGLVSLIIYYSFLIDVAIAAKNSVVNVIDSGGLSNVTVPLKEYNGSGWDERVISLDLAGLIDIIMTLIIVFGPIVVLIKLIY